MIFISYTHSDSDIVDPVANAIGDHFGRDNVFFDKWSISPGESIIGRMNEGLAQCSHFFLFMSENSLGKAFVSLEWQSALAQAAQGGIARLVPIRATETNIPPILSHMKYIDMYMNGSESTVKEMIELIENGMITPIINSKFNNIEARIIPVAQLSLSIEISAKRFVVPHAFFAIVYLSSHEVSVWIKGEGAIHSKRFMMALTKDGVEGRYSAIHVGTGRPLTPGIPVTLQVTSTGPFDLHAIMHQVGENRYDPIPVASS